MSRTADRVLAVAFLALGAGLVASSFGLPAGVGRVPGPGFFPRVIGGATLLLALLLLGQTRGAAPRAPAAPADLRAALGAMALLALYLSSWGTGLFALRTAVFLALFLRFLGQPWKPALAVSITLSAAVFFVFSAALGVSLD